MAYIGCLGDVPFEVSSKTVQTLNNMQWSGSAKYATHQRHGGNALTEFIGNNPDKFKFDMVLSAYLGVDPMDATVKLFNYMREGRALILVIGSRTFGKYRWTITDYTVRLQTTDGDGDILTLTVSVSLQEYIKG